MKKILCLSFLIFLLAAGQAAASEFTYTIGIGNTGALGLANYPGPYGTIHISVPDIGGDATITVTGNEVTSGGTTYVYLLGQPNVVDLSVANPSAVTVSRPPYTYVNNYQFYPINPTGPDPYSTTLTSFTPGLTTFAVDTTIPYPNVAGFGHFPITSDNDQSPAHAYSSITFTLKDNFPDAQHVLVPNDSQYFSVDHFLAFTKDASGNLYQVWYTDPGSGNRVGLSGFGAAVPVPSTVLLLGTGVFGLGLLGWRRRRS